MPNPIKNNSDEEYRVNFQKSSLGEFAKNEDGYWATLYYLSYVNFTFTTWSLAVAASKNSTNLSTLLNMTALLSSIDPFIAAFTLKPTPLMHSTSALYHAGIKLSNSFFKTSAMQNNATGITPVSNSAQKNPELNIDNRNKSELEAFLLKQDTNIGAAYSIAYFLLCASGTGLAIHTMENNPGVATASALVSLYAALDPYIAACTDKPSPLLYASSGLYQSAMQLKNLLFKPQVANSAEKVNEEKVGDNTYRH